MKSFKVMAHRASRLDPVYSFTYRTSQFPQWKIHSGDTYFVEFEDGQVIKMKASRDGTTLYSGKVKYHAQPIPQIGQKVVHRVVNIAKCLKQLEATAA